MRDIHECCSMDCQGSIKNEDMLDIMILSYGQSETAALWVTYLTSCFQQISKEQNRPPFKLVCVQLEDIFLGITATSHQDRLAKARLQIIILCPGFLEHISSNPGPASTLSNVLQPSRAIVMLLGVSEESVTIHHRTALLCFDEWRKVVVKDQDPTFVGDFLGISMDILSRSWQIQQAINQLRNDENKAHFSLIPKKIKLGQNKLIVLLNDPLDNDDKIKIFIDKNGQRLEANSVKRRNPYTLQFAVPATCLQVSMLASVFVEKNGKSLGHRLVKCESRMRELDQLLRSSDNALQFMCQTLGLNPGDRDQLDLFLVSALQRNLPPYFNLLQPPPGHRFHSSNEEYPTLLHFAAHFGLEKLAWQLLECPGGEQACQLRNACQLTPADMAERAGHIRLANALKGYLQMTELSSMYSYLKGISGKQTPGFNDTNYLLPRPLNDTYLIPPAARPISTSTSTITIPSTFTVCSSCPTTPISQPSTPFYTNLESYKVPPSPVSLNSPIDYNVSPALLQLPLESVFENSCTFSQSSSSSTPITPSTPKDNLPHGGYLEMHSSDGQSVTKRKCNPIYCEQNNRENQERQIYTTSNDNISGHQECSRSETNRKSSTSSNNSAKHSQHGVQDELVEIINDFKNNVFTIAEVEKLVASWQKRHDVQQSFKEKQEQLNAMREEYERIQQAMKSQMKRATPFEKIRKFFSRGKSKHGCRGDCRKEAKEVVEGGNQTGNVCHRPASSLSLRSSCSSGSSGRMSTGSGTSLGDSGTHSDPDDKKNNSCDVYTVQPDLKSKLTTGLLYYDIPPSASDLRLARPPPMTDLAEYVTPDNKSCSTILGRSTSLTEKDTIQEDQEISASNSGDCKEENEESLTEDHTEDNNEDATIEADREFAVVEVHPPPLKEITPIPEKNSIVCDQNDESTLSSQQKNIQNNNQMNNEDSSDEIISKCSENKKCQQNNFLAHENEHEQNEPRNTFNDDYNESRCVNINCHDNFNINKDYSFKDCHNCIPNNGYNCIPEKYEDNSDEESAKETDHLLENLQLHDYMNVSVHAPPPVPPRGKYGHVTL